MEDVEENVVDPLEDSLVDPSGDSPKTPHSDPHETTPVNDDPETPNFHDEPDVNETSNYDETVRPDFKVKGKPNKRKRKLRGRLDQGRRETPPPNTALARIEAMSKGRANTKDLEKKGRSNRKYNWEQLAKEYIEGIETPGKEERVFPTMKELAELHGVPAQMVRARASKERWTEKKDAHAMRLAKERLRKRQSLLLNKGVDFDDRAHKAAELGVGLITNRLAEIAQEISRRQKVRDNALAMMDAGLPINKEDLYSAINYREMEGLASALSRFQEVGMKALGTDVTRHEISGPDQTAIEVKTNIRHEISRDDPERIAAIVSSFEDAGLLELGTVQEIIDAEIVEEDKPPVNDDSEVPQEDGAKA